MALLVGLVSASKPSAPNSGKIAVLVNDATPSLTNETVTAPAAPVTVTLSPIAATLIGSNCCSALGLTGEGNVPILDLCSKLVAAGHDPRLSLHAYRGDVLCLRVSAIGEAAALEVSQHGAGFVGRHGRRACPPAAKSHTGRPAHPRAGKTLPAPAMPRHRQRKQARDENAALAEEHAREQCSRARARFSWRLNSKQ